MPPSLNERWREQLKEATSSHNACERYHDFEYVSPEDAEEIVERALLNQRKELREAVAKELRTTKALFFEGCSEGYSAAETMEESALRIFDQLD